jgi:hypothetical protein
LEVEEVQGQLRMVLRAVRAEMLAMRRVSMLMGPVMLGSAVRFGEERGDAQGVGGRVVCG